MKKRKLCRQRLAGNPWPTGAAPSLLAEHRRYKILCTSVSLWQNSTVELPDFKALWEEWKQRRWKEMTVPGAVICLIGCGILAIPVGQTPMGRFPLLHNITVVPHEGGHMIVHGFFNLVSPISGGADEKPMRFPRLAPVAIAIAGTLGQLLAFAAPAAYFWYKKSPTPLGFFLFCLFGNFIGIGIYMMDCRIFTLDYVSYGEVDYENIASLHDWATIFNLMHWNLAICEALGRFARVMGWVGMAATAFVWMPLMYRRTQRPQPAEATEPAAAMLTSPHEPRVPGGSEALLLVQKDQGDRQRLAGLLRHKGYAVLEAESLLEAMRKATARPRPIQLVIARFSGAEASGPQVVAALRAVYPLVKALLLMGPGDPPVVTPDIPAADCLREPFDQNAVAMKVREVLDTPASTALSGN